MSNDLWQEVNLGDICDIFDGPHATPKKIDAGPVFLGVQNLNEGRLDLSNTAHLSEADYLAWTRRVEPQSNDLVFAYETGVGAAAIIPENFRCCLGRRLGLLRAKRDHILPEFLIYAYLGPVFQSTLREHTIYGSTVNRIPLSEMADFPILIPPLPEQRKIAEILSTWDEAIALTEALIAALQTRKQALMQLLLTGQVRFPGFDGEWEEKHLGVFLKPRLRKVAKPSTGYLALGIRSHGKGTFTKLVDNPDTVAMDELYQVKEDDLIVNITFAWEGAIALVSQQDEGKLVSHRFPTYEFDRRHVIPEFFKYVMLTQEFFFRLGLISPGGAGRNRVLNKKDFLGLMVSAPSIQEQQKIGEVLGATDKHIEMLSGYSGALQQQKRGLMQQLLTGAVRV